MLVPVPAQGPGKPNKTVLLFTVYVWMKWVWFSSWQLENMDRKIIMKFFILFHWDHLQREREKERVTLNSRVWEQKMSFHLSGCYSLSHYVLWVLFSVLSVHLPACLVRNRVAMRVMMYRFDHSMWENSSLWLTLTHNNMYIPLRLNKLYTVRTFNLHGNSSCMEFITEVFGTVSVYKRVCV